MAERIRKLTNSEVEVLARIIADTMTGSQMNEIFQECGVQDASNESTKWKRIYYTFLARQEPSQTAIIRVAGKIAFV